MSPFPALISSSLLVFLAHNSARLGYNKKVRKNVLKPQYSASVSYKVKYFLTVQRTYFMTNIGNVGITFGPVI